MRQTGKRERVWRAGLIVFGILLLSGCGKKKPEDMPEDTPWNHGCNAIMETENGYYFNRSDTSFNPWGQTLTNQIDGKQTEQTYIYCVGQRLMYWEKKSGNSILLCNKPECEHNFDDSCEATYRGILTVNTLLYDGNLYILGEDVEGDTVSINLYRGALDGSAIDKIGTVIQGDNVSGLSVDTICDPNGFLIHKGYAYIPYYLKFGVGFKGFMGGGVVKMNILTGEMQELYTMEGHKSPFPHVSAAVGDYVYFYTSTDSHSYYAKKSYRYKISEDKVEEVGIPAPTKRNPDKISPILYDAYADDCNYISALSGGDTSAVISLFAYDITTHEDLPDKNIITDIPYSQHLVMCYGDKVMFATESKVVWYTRDGEKLGEIEIPFEVGSSSYYFNEGIWFKVSNERQYMIYCNRNMDPIDRIENAAAFWESWKYEVYYCELKDLFENKGEWQKAFEMNRLYGPNDLPEKYLNRTRVITGEE